MNKTIFLFLCFYLFLNREGRGQGNLVPNNSFETYTSCPNDTNDFINAPPWYNPTGGTPDYYNHCDTIPHDFGVPINALGFQYAKTGVAYAGICVYGGGSVREYLQVELTDTLISNNHYCVSFYVSNVRESGGYWDAITKMGLLFSNNAITSSTTSILPYTPQLTSPDSVFLSDTLNWMEISGTYIALGGEKYITIGNFNDDAHTVILNYGITGGGAYYYVDEISIVDCTDAGINVLSTTNKITISPNPFTSQTTITFSEEQRNTIIKITDVLGNVIKTVILSAARNLTIDKGTMQPGIYFVQITDEKGNRVNRKVVVE